MNNIDSPFEVLSAMDLFERLTEQEQYIVGWKTGIHGPVKTSKSLAKELGVEVNYIDDSYSKSINFIKKHLLDE